MCQKAISEFDYIVSLDTGLSGTGVVIFNNTGLPIGYKNVTVKDYTNNLRTYMRDEAHAIFTAIRKIIKDYSGVLMHLSKVLLILELPELYDSAKSQAAFKTGSVMLMSLFSGYLFAYFASIDVIGVKPSMWKGQLPKRIIKLRMLKKYGFVYPSHSCDAQGIGAWLLSDFENNYVKCLNPYKKEG